MFVFSLPMIPCFHPPAKGKSPENVRWNWSN